RQKLDGASRGVPAEGEPKRAKLSVLRVDGSMRLDLRNRTQACVSAAQIVVGIVGCGKPAHSAGLTRRGKLPPPK
ncbi:MAG: hypothetical protein WC966_10790, partial [Bradymonadales bacterium]